MSIFDGFVQAEAIRKILGQDSSRKKREDKMKKRREELEQVLRIAVISLLAYGVLNYEVSL